VVPLLSWLLLGALIAASVSARRKMSSAGSASRPTNS
jgi:hypothetical protein